MKAKEILKAFFDQGLSAEFTDYFQFTHNVNSDIMNYWGGCYLRGSIKPNQAYFIYIGNCADTLDCFPPSDFKATFLNDDSAVYGWLIED